jgi:putative hydrolase of the HAD superfamily
VIEIVFLDAGETILHPFPSFPDLFAKVVNAHGHEVSLADARSVQSRLAPHLVDLAADSGVRDPSLSAAASREFWSFLYRRLLAELGIEDELLVGRLYDTFSDSSSYRLFDDALPAMRALRRAGYRLGLISNFEEWLEEMLVELEVGELFDVRVISGIEGVEKPDPRIFEVALERAGLPANGAAHVGDSPALDVEPAKSVGIHPILLDRWDRYPDATVARVRSLAELPALVGGIRARAGH